MLAAQQYTPEMEQQKKISSEGKFGTFEELLENTPVNQLAPHEQQVITISSKATVEEAISVCSSCYYSVLDSFLHLIIRYYPRIRFSLHPWYLMKRNKTKIENIWVLSTCSIFSYTF
jgi:hypothetical protein